MEPTTKSVQATQVTLPRFGAIAYAETDVIEFPLGIPGFPKCRRWLFLTLESQPTFVWLQSLDDLAVAIPTANPWTIYEDYDPALPAYAFGTLGISNASDFTLLCVTVVEPDAREMTMDLAAPILVNLRSRKALQVSLPGYGSHRERIPRTYDTADAALAAKAS